MGWLFKSGYSRRDLIDHLTKSETWVQEDGLTVTRTCIRHCCRGNTLWIVGEWVRSDGTSERAILCCLMQRSSDGFGWGYKDMEESMHPYYYSCPIGYLDLVPPPKSGSTESWREAVRQHNARHQDYRRRLREWRAARRAA
jgi:hypothetical protein